ncbi:MAG: hypothetical protein IPF52_15725 [Saprospiraceae bacterium]|nr:hypothetical protein [Saprospiraceae bacterium]
MSDKLIIFFLIFTLLSSCGVDEFDTSDIDIEIIEADTVIVNDIMTKARSNTSASGVQIECVTVLFPLRVIDDKNIIHFINSENEFHSFLLTVLLSLWILCIPWNLLTSSVLMLWRIIYWI